MTIAELKQGIANGTFTRNPDGTVRPTSLREQYGLSVTRVMPNPKNNGKTAIRFRGITPQDILRREGLRKLASLVANRKDGCVCCAKFNECGYANKALDNSKCFMPDGKGGCKNKTKAANHE